MVVRRWHEGGDGQGYGPRATEQPRAFKPNELEEALAFFRRERFVLIDDALSAAELDFLNGFCERSQAEKSAAWGIPDDGSQWGGGIYLQPLLDHPELDKYTQHPSNYGPVCDILGGPDKPRFAEFNFREAPEGGESKDIAAAYLRPFNEDQRCCHKQPANEP